MWKVNGIQLRARLHQTNSPFHSIPQAAYTPERWGCLSASLFSSWLTILATTRHTKTSTTNQNSINSTRSLENNFSHHVRRRGRPFRSGGMRNPCRLSSSRASFASSPIYPYSRTRPFSPNEPYLGGWYCSGFSIKSMQLLRFSSADKFYREFYRSLWRMPSSIALSARSVHFGDTLCSMQCTYNDAANATGTGVACYLQQNAHYH
jgi:hypothetical protein